MIGLRLRIVHRISLSKLRLREPIVVKASLEELGFLHVAHSLSAACGPLAACCKKAAVLEKGLPQSPHGGRFGPLFFRVGLRDHRRASGWKCVWRTG